MSLPRLELKYRVTEAAARAVRDYVGSFLELDRYVTNRASRSYPVDSLYLDSDDLTTFWSTVNGAKCRYKLRARTYSDAPDAPVFLEIKRRINAHIVKSRAPVRREAAAALLQGQLPTPDDMASTRQADLLAAENFVRLVQEIDATPRARVRYQREAWLSPYDPGVRLTLDRDVVVTPAFNRGFTDGGPVEPARPFGDIVILEIKYSGRAPTWVRDIQQIGELKRTSAAKYCDGILTHGVDNFTPTCTVPMGAGAHENVETRRRGLPALAPLPGALPSFA